MITIPHQIMNVTHPLIANMYIKKVLSKNNRSLGVLVIETKKTTEKDSSKSSDFDFYNLLADLQDIKNEVEKEAGSIDRIDIRNFCLSA